MSRITDAMERLGITRTQVAAEAGKTARSWRGRRSVSLATVSLVLAGHRRSANVVATAKRLIAAARAAKRARAA